MLHFGPVSGILALVVMLAGMLSTSPSYAWATQVSFDLPDTIECRDVTPRDFAAAHPSLKVIEAKLRISARINEGSEAEIVDFLYIITSPDKRMKFQDYLPNTTLESTLAEDRIEVAETTENTNATSADARVSYQVLALGGSKNQSAKKSESSHYKQIVPKALVLASGTTDREHGVFFKLRASKVASHRGGPRSLRSWPRFPNHGAATGARSLAPRGQETNHFLPKALRRPESSRHKSESTWPATPKPRSWPRNFAGFRMRTPRC